MSQGLTEVVLRNNFYRDKYRHVTLAFLWVLCLNILLAGLIFYKITNKPKPEYFATTSDGKIIELEPLTAPVLTDAELLQFASQAASAAYTYNYVNYRKELQDASNYFTTAGWRDFQEALKKSKLLEAVLAGQLVGHASPTGAPIIEDRGIINGRYAWKVALPLLATFERPGRRITQPLTLTMVLTRVPILSAAKGVEIASFFASERKIN